MDITVGKKELVRELQLVQGIVERKTSIPVLSNVLAEAADGELRLAATDLDVSLRGGLPAKVTRPGAITLAAKKLYEIARSLPEADVHIQAEEDSWVSIECERARFRMAGLPREDFPALPEPGGSEGIELPAAVLLDLIHRTAFAITAEEARYYLAGALLVLEADRVALVATDGHRLAWASREVQVGGEPQRVLVPKKAVSELGRLLEGAESVHFAQVENHLVFRVGDHTLASKTIEGQFPAFEKVIAVSGDKSVSLGREPLTTALRRVSLLSSERSRAIRLSLQQGTLELTASSPDLGEARESLPVEYSGDGVEVGFNAQYILDFLVAVGSDAVRLELKDAESQGIFRPDAGGASPGADDYRYVVMPMRL